MHGSLGNCNHIPVRRMRDAGFPNVYILRLPLDGADDRTCLEVPSDDEQVLQIVSGERQHTAIRGKDECLVVHVFSHKRFEGLKSLEGR